MFEFIYFSVAVSLIDVLFDSVENITMTAHSKPNLRDDYDSLIGFVLVRSLSVIVTSWFID
jgi:hypothetical protein